MFIDETADYIRTSEQINWAMWEFEANAQARHSSYNVGGGFKGDELAGSFDAAVELLKTNYGRRVSGMDKFVTEKAWPDLSYRTR